MSLSDALEEIEVKNEFKNLPKIRWIWPLMAWSDQFLPSDGRHVVDGDEVKVN